MQIHVVGDVEQHHDRWPVATMKSQLLSEDFRQAEPSTGRKSEPEVDRHVREYDPPAVDLAHEEEIRAGQFYSQVVDRIPLEVLVSSALCTHRYDHSERTTHR